MSARYLPRYIINTYHPDNHSRRKKLHDSNSVKNSGNVGEKKKSKVIENIVTTCIIR